MLSPRLVGSSELDLIHLGDQQLVVGWSRLALAPCGLSSLNKLTRYVLIVVSGDVCRHTQDLLRPKLGSGREPFLHLLAKAS